MDIDLNLFDSLSAKVPLPDSEVLIDGVLCCGVCGDKVETEIEVFGMKKKVRCICSCKVKEIEAQQEKERSVIREKNRAVCFSETNMKNWNFTNDDRSNPQISDAMKRYADNFNDFLKKGEGLLLYGSVGTGKTYYAACIANTLIDNNYTALMTNFARLTNQLQGMYDGRNEFIDHLNRYSLLVIDDLGAERGSEYMRETVFNIIDARYRSGMPFIITTNLSPDEMKNADQISYSRIYDRIMERCFPLKVDGASRRRQNMKDSYAETKEMLGL